MDEETFPIHKVENNPMPLHRKVQEPDEYPVWALGPLERVTNAIHEVSQAPLGICGQSVLAATALATQVHANVFIGGSSRPISEFFISVAETGERKSTVDGYCLKPHRSYIASLRSRYAEEIQQYENDMDIYKSKRKGILRQKEINKEALNELGCPPSKPIRPVLTLQEPTYEGLIEFLRDGPPGVGIFSDEGGRMLGGYGMNKEHKQTFATGLSELWDGTDISRSRVQGGTVILEGRRLSLHLMIQPTFCSQLFDDEFMLSQGILGRMLTSYPKPTSGTREFRNLDINMYQEYGNYQNKIIDLLNTPAKTKKDNPRVSMPDTILFNRDAKDIFVNFFNDVENKLGKDGALNPIKGLANKACQHSLRLAAILTIYDDKNASEISAEKMKFGIALMKYYLSEALRICESFSIPEDICKAEKLLDWARRKKQIYLPHVYQNGPRVIRTAETAKKAISILVEHNWLKPVNGGQEINGKHRAHVWEVMMPN